MHTHTLLAQAEAYHIIDARVFFGGYANVHLRNTQEEEEGTVPCLLFFTHIIGSPTFCKTVVFNEICKQIPILILGIHMVFFLFDILYVKDGKDSDLFVAFFQMLKWSQNSKMGRICNYNPLGYTKTRTSHV